MYVAQWVIVTSFSSYEAINASYVGPNFDP